MAFKYASGGGLSFRTSSNAVYPPKRDTLPGNNFVNKALTANYEEVVTIH